MAIAGCNCSGTLGNTGYPTGAKSFGLVKGKIFMPILDASGARNGIDLTSTTLEADILAAVNNRDPSKRMYIFNNINNAAAPGVAPTYATTDTNEREVTSKGITNVKWEMWGVNEQWFAKVENACVDFGEYEIDVCGNLKGQKEGTMLYPRPVKRGSYSALPTPASATTKFMVSFDYDYEYITSAADQWMLPVSDFGVNNPLTLKGMVDVNVAITVVSATELTLVTTFDYGYANVSLPWKGGVVGDLLLANITTPATITPVSLTETSDGTYTLIIPAQVAADNCTLQVYKSASGVVVNGYISEVEPFIAQ